MVEFINFLNSFGLKVLYLDSLASWANASLPVQLVHLASLVRLVQLNLLASLTWPSLFQLLAQQVALSVQLASLMQLSHLDCLAFLSRHSLFKPLAHEYALSLQLAHCSVLFEVVAWFDKVSKEWFTMVAKKWFSKVWKEYWPSEWLVALVPKQQACRIACTPTKQ